MAEFHKGRSFLRPTGGSFARAMNRAFDVRRV
jgi:hypothetical protein